MTLSERLVIPGQRKEREGKPLVAPTRAQRALADKLPVAPVAPVALSMQESIVEYVSACFSGLWIQSLEHEDALREIARGIATEDGELPEGDELQTVLDAAAGLARYEAEGAFSLSVVRHQAIRPESVWELKAGMLKKSGLLQLYRGGERFDALGGLQALKTFCLRSMRNQGHRDPLRRPRGVLLLSPPGCGKSQFAKCLGNGKPLSQLLGGHRPSYR